MAALLAGALLATACTQTSPPPTASPPTTPAVTATPSPSPSAGCGEYPTPACTGVPPGTKLTELQLNMDGETLRITKPGTVLDAVHVPGNLLITADDVTITNSQIDGQIMGVYDNKRYSFDVSDSTVGPTDRCDTAPGILDAGFTATRVHIRGHGDGFSVSGDNVTIQDSFVLLCSNSGDHSDGIRERRRQQEPHLPPQHGRPAQGSVAHRPGLPGRSHPGRHGHRQPADRRDLHGADPDRARRGRAERRRGGQARGLGPASIDCANTDWSGNSLVTIDDDYNVTSTVGPLACPS